MPTFNDLKNLVENYIVNKFHKFIGLVATLFIAYCLLLPLHAVINNDFNYEWYLYSFVSLLIIVFWVVFRYFWPYRRNIISKTGLVISIFSNNYEGVKMKNIFIFELNRQLIDSGLDKYFYVIPLLNHQSEKIKTIVDINNANKKIKGHIYFFGDVQKEYDGKDGKKYFLNIDGNVCHMPIPIPVSQELSFDFRTMLPKEINFSEFFELRGCKATAKIVYLTTRYVVGVASFLSGNPFLAFDMHKDLVNELSEYDRIDNDNKLKDLTDFDFKKLKNIKNKLPLIISNEAYVIARAHYAIGDKEKTREFLLISLQNNKHNYSAWLLEAIYNFQIDDDAPKASTSIKNAKKYAKNQYEWMYSFTFLKFWNHEYEDAYKMCQKITNQSYEQEYLTLNEVEEFNLNILKHKNIPQLYFWIGYLNYKKKKNLEKSLSYFEKFIELADKVTMNYLILKTQSFLGEIKNNMKIDN